MAQDIMNLNFFAIEVFAHGKTQDIFPGGDTYTLEAWTIRMNPVALNAWHDSSPVDVSEWEWIAESKEQAEIIRDAHEAKRAEVIDNIRKALEIDQDGITVTHCLSEIFTVVRIVKE